MTKRGYLFCILCAVVAIGSLLIRPALSAVDADGTLGKPFNVLVKNGDNAAVPIRAPIPIPVKVEGTVSTNGNVSVTRTNSSTLKIEFIKRNCDINGNCDGPDMAAINADLAAGFHVVAATGQYSTTGPGGNAVGGSLTIFLEK